jgi:two-component system chemotaxis response regulator CheY
MRHGIHVILCIDDDQDFLDSIRLILEAHNYIMEEAVSAEMGLKKYKEIQPDLLIVDLMMEEIDSGTNFVKELRLLGNTAPIYMLSSAGDELFMTTDYTDLGLAGIFQKPIQPDILLSTLREKLK